MPDCVRGCGRCRGEGHNVRNCRTLPPGLLVWLSVRGHVLLSLSLFLYRAVVGIICTGCVGNLELGGYFRTRLGFGGHLDLYSERKSKPNHQTCSGRRHRHRRPYPPLPSPPATLREAPPPPNFIAIAVALSGI